MNDLLRQLIGVAPGLAAGLRGNGQGMQAFLESYQRTNALLDQQARQQQADRMTLEDRQRAIAQQQTTAARLAESDRMAAEDRSRRRAMETIGVGDQLAKVGGLQDSPQGAESAIDALYQMLAPSFGGVEALGGIRDAAIGQARQTITARQQRQVSEFVEQALKVDHVANNPDSDPVIHNLPDHIVKIVGTPVAKLSDLQKFAQLPVGKPVRPPSAEVSMQTKDLLGPDGKPHTYNFNPKTGEYTQAQGVSPIPPKASGSEDAKSFQSKEMMVNGKLTTVNFDPKTGVYTDQDGNRVRVDPVAPNPKEPNQAQFGAAMYASRMEQAEPILTKVAPSIEQMKLPSFILQTDSWFAKPTFQSKDVQSYMQAARNFINAVLRRESGAVISPEEFADAKQQYLPVPGDTPEVKAQKAANRKLVIDIMRRSAGSAYESQVTPPKLKERRTFDGTLAEWDGTGWKKVPM